MSCDKKRIVESLVYTAAIFMTLTAGWLTLSGLEARRQEGQAMHTALQMQAMQTMERMECNALSDQVAFAVTEYHQLRQQLEGFIYKMHWEEDSAKQDGMRAQILQNTATQDQEEATAWALQVNATEHERFALIQTIHEERQEEKEMQQQLRDADFSGWLCETRGISQLCNLIGGITNLQEQVDETDLQIHRDMERLKTISQQEYLQIIAYQALQDKADMYQHVADDLVRTASLWMEQAKTDQTRVSAIKQEADWVEKQVVALEKQSRSCEDSIYEMTDVVRGLLENAHRYEKSSIAAFCGSIVLLLIPLVAFTLRCVAEFTSAFNRLTIWYKNNQHDTKELCRGPSYIILHVLFFLATIAACRDYVADLDQYSTRKRFIVILYFAFLGSLLQSFWIQAVPHMLFEQPWSTYNGTFRTSWTIVKWFVIRAMLLLPPFRGAVIDPSRRMIFFVYFSLALALVWYFLYLEPRQVRLQEQLYHRDDHSTVNQDDSDDEEFVQETTPLKAAHSITDTELFLEIAVARMMDATERNGSSHCSLDASSPYYVDFRNGFNQILLLTESFVLMTALVILNVNAELLVPAHVNAVRIGVGCLVVGIYLTLAYGGRWQGPESLTQRTVSEFNAKTINF